MEIEKSLIVRGVEIQIPDSIKLYVELIPADSRKKAHQKSLIWDGLVDDTVSLNLGAGWFLIAKKFAYEKLKLVNPEFLKQIQSLKKGEA